MVKENNDLHMQLIKLKEECEQRENGLKTKAKQAQAQLTDLQFLTQQKDIKIRELDKVVVEMQNKLEKALTKVYAPQANDIVKGLRKDAGGGDNIIARKQEITSSFSTLHHDSQNLDPNRPS